MAFWPSGDISQSINFWPSSFLHVRMPVWVHQNDGILVEHTFVVFNENLQVTLVLEVCPCATVGQHVTFVGDGHIERLVHALSNRFVPRSLLLLDVAVADKGTCCPTVAH